MTTAKVNQKVRVQNTTCIGVKIVDHSYDAIITKVNKRSFYANGYKFVFKKVLSNGKTLYKNAFEHAIIL